MKVIDVYAPADWSQGHYSGLVWKSGLLARILAPAYFEHSDANVPSVRQVATLRQQVTAALTAPSGVVSAQKQKSKKNKSSGLTQTDAPPDPKRTKGPRPKGTGRGGGRAIKRPVRPEGQGNQAEEPKGKEARLDEAQAEGLVPTPNGGGGHGPSSEFLRSQDSGGSGSVSSEEAFEHMPLAAAGPSSDVPAPPGGAGPAPTSSGAAYVAPLRSASSDGVVSGVSTEPLRAAAHDALLPAAVAASLTDGGFLVPFSSITRGERIGGGAACDVYKVQYNGGAAALKQLRLDAVSAVEREEVMSCLRRELRAMRGLKHPNVVTFLGVVHEPSSNVVGLLLEEAPHRSLRDLLNQEQGCVVGVLHQQMSLAIGIAKGMAYLHELFVLHHDLKSGNVRTLLPIARCLLPAGLSAWTVYVARGLCMLQVLVHSDSFGTYLPKLSDFGQAYAAAGTTGGGSMRADACTVAYAAPEQGDGTITVKSEVYSYGIVLWELLHGAKPWAKCTMVKIVNSVAQGQRPPVNVPESLLRQTMVSCWQPDPDSRPSFPDVVCRLSGDVVSRGVENDASRVAGAAGDASLRVTAVDGDGRSEAVPRLLESTVEEAAGEETMVGDGERTSSDGMVCASCAPESVGAVADAAAAACAAAPATAVSDAQLVSATAAVTVCGQGVASCDTAGGVSTAGTASATAPALTACASLSVAASSSSSLVPPSGVPPQSPFAAGLSASTQEWYKTMPKAIDCPFLHQHPKSLVGEVFMRLHLPDPQRPLLRCDPRCHN